MQMARFYQRVSAGHYRLARLAFDCGLIDRAIFHQRNAARTAACAREFLLELIGNAQG